MHSTSAGHSRRRFLTRTLALTAGTVALTHFPALAQPQPASGPRMRLCLTPGSIGVSANQAQAIELAQRHGFEAVEPYGTHLASLSDAQIRALSSTLQDAGLVWGAAGLPVDFRGSEDGFNKGLAQLPAVAAAVAKAGASRMGTWLMPCHSSLTYVANLKLHAQRLRQVAKILQDHGLRLGLEYVGTYTLWTSRKYPFVHSMAETQDLIAEIGLDNVGLILDSWHWWQADDTADQIRALRPTDIVSVDLNDAPLNVAKKEQRDGQRELPAATGVIDLSAFIKALNAIGYDGPARPEPFNRALNNLDNEAACAAAIAAMRRAQELA